MCSIEPPSYASVCHIEVMTLWPVSAAKVSGRTNSSAARVITTCTSSEYCCKARTSSAALYAAMPPVTPSVTLMGSWLGMICSYKVVVNQARFAQMGGYGDQRPARGLRQRQQGVGINHGGVFHNYRGFGCQHLLHGFNQRLGVAFAASVKIGGCVERAVQDGGANALLRRKVAVARAEGQPVRLAHDGAGDEFHGKIKLAHHGAEDGQLRGILLPEVGAVGRDDVEELGDDGRHSAKVAGTVCPVQAVADAGYFNEGRRAAGNQRLGGGCKENLRTGGSERGAISLKRARVAVEVFAGAELQRIDEDGGGHVGAIALRRVDEREMAGVQCAHGGHKRERAAAP